MPVVSTNLPEIQSELVSALARAHASVDLTGEGRVAPGLYAAPPGGVPFACVAPPDVRVEEGRARRLIWERTATFRIRAWAAFPQETEASRVSTTTALLEDILAAVEDRAGDSEAILNTIDRVRVAGAELAPVIADSVPTFAAVDVLVEVHYRRVIAG